MGKTKIDWCDRVWNPTIGCTKVSQGCKFCYAERIYERFHPGQKFSDIHCIPGRLEMPLHWRQPQRVFVDSMSDLFHEDVPFEFILLVWAKIAVSQQHTFMILTKRPTRMREIVEKLVRQGYGLPGNVWLGVSVEDQATADERIPLLLQTPAAKRFVNYEPALGPLDLDSESANELHVLGCGDDHCTCGDRGIDWLIMGCESGPGARPMDIEWARSARDQCQAAGVPFFLKQMMVDGKLIHMPFLDRRTWKQFPEVK
jgi:protein gp37